MSFLIIEKTKDLNDSWALYCKYHFNIARKLFQWSRWNQMRFFWRQSVPDFDFPILLIVLFACFLSFINIFNVIGFLCYLEKRYFVEKEFSLWFISEAVVRRCSVEKVFLEVSQNLQENTCARVSFLIKLPEACNFIKKETMAQVFSCEFYKISKNTFFTEHLRWLLLSFVLIFLFLTLRNADAKRRKSHSMSWMKSRRKQINDSNGENC